MNTPTRLTSLISDLPTGEMLPIEKEIISYLTIKDFNALSRVSRRNRLFYNQELDMLPTIRETQQIVWRSPTRLQRARMLANQNAFTNICCIIIGTGFSVPIFIFLANKLIGDDKALIALTAIGFTLACFSISCGAFHWFACAGDRSGGAHQTQRFFEYAGGFRRPVAPTHISTPLIQPGDIEECKTSEEHTKNNENVFNV